MATARSALQEARTNDLKAQLEGAMSYQRVLWVEIYGNALVEIADAAAAYVRTHESVELRVLESALEKLALKRANG